MNIDRRVTGGLAWAGLLLVVAVPSADMIASRIATEGSGPLEATVQLPRQVERDPIQTGSATIIQAARNPLPVSEASATSQASVAPRALPSYLSDGPDESAEVAALPDPVEPEPATTPAVAAESVVAVRPVEPVRSAPTVIIHQPNRPATVVGGTPAQPVVSVEPGSAGAVAAVEPDPMIEAPVPMPRSMRPASVASTPALVPPADIVPEEDRFAAANSVYFETNDEIISAEELEEWESGPLSEFLEQRRRGAQADRNIDRDGFFLDEGPNNDRRRVKPDDVDNGGTFFFIN